MDNRDIFYKNVNHVSNKEVKVNNSYKMKTLIYWTVSVIIVILSMSIIIFGGLYFIKPYARVNGSFISYLNNKNEIKVGRKVLVAESNKDFLDTIGTLTESNKVSIYKVKSLPYAIINYKNNSRKLEDKEYLLECVENCKEGEYIIPYDLILGYVK